jgi:alpha-N-arabinofuranosidase
MLLTPTYHVFRMYVPFQDATFLPVSYDPGKYTHGSIELPRVDAIAAKGADGKVWLALTNLDPARPVTFEIPGNAKAARGETLSAPRFNSVNTFESPQTVKPQPVSVKAAGGKLAVKLAPASVTVIALD